jgi:hypothetical protein
METPPLLVGAVHERLTAPTLFTVAVKPVGAFGTIAE